MLSHTGHGCPHASCGMLSHTSHGHRYATPKAGPDVNAAHVGPISRPGPKPLRLVHGRRGARVDIMPSQAHLRQGHTRHALMGVCQRACAHLLHTRPAHPAAQPVSDPGKLLAEWEAAACGHECASNHARGSGYPARGVAPCCAPTHAAAATPHVVLHLVAHPRAL